MTIHQLIYTSRAPDLDFADLTDLVTKAQAVNVGASVTGILIYGNEYVLQLIEGPAAGVNMVYHTRIARDTRHHDLTLITYRETDKRMFPHWSMSLATLTEDTRLDLLEIGNVKEFNPTGWTCDQALAFIERRGQQREGLVVPGSES